MRSRQRLAQSAKSFMKQESKIANPHSKNFPCHPSPEFEKAVKSLEKLAKVAGVDVCADAYALASSDLWAEDFGNAHRVTLASGRCCIQRLLGKKCRLQYESCECQPPGARHASLWEREGEAKYYVSELSRWDMSIMEKAIEFSRRHELEFEIIGSGGSYYPSKSFSVIYRDPRKSR